MKKILFTVALAAAAIAPAAAETYKLESIIANTDLDKFYFTWNDINRIQTVNGKIETETGPVVYRREFAYDEEGRQITESLFQNFNVSDFDPDWHKTDELRYTYNTKGQLAERLQYSYDKQDVETFQSVTKFVYDEAGLLESETVYFDTTQQVPLSRDDYKYDADRRIVERVTLLPGSVDGVFQPYQAVTYTYVDELLTEVGEFDVDPKDGGRKANAYKIYKYDAEGNLVSINMTGSNKLVTVARFDFEYNDIPREEILYPEAYEKPELNINGEYDLIRFGIKSLKDYEEDVTSNQLFLFDTYNYTYGKIETGGIAAPSADSAILIPAVCGGNLSLAGVAPLANVTVYDMQGRPVMTGRYRQGGLDINALPAGAYIVRAGSAVAKFTK